MKEEFISRGHSWRNFEAEEFAEAWEEAESREEEIEIREAFEFIEDGRFAEMVDASYEFFLRLDPDERRKWAEENEELIEWVGVRGKIHHQNTLEKYTGISSGI